MYKNLNQQSTNTNSKSKLVPAALAELTFIATLPSETPNDEPVYLAADFAGWKPDNPNYVMTRNGNNASLTISLPSNTNFRYKYTRGNWFTVETTASGNSLPNRRAVAVHGKVIHDNIANWQDKVVKIPLIDSRVERVTLNSKILKVPKSFYVFVPPDYDEPEQQGELYPVLYLFRGHEREWVNLEEDHSRENRTVIDAYMDAYERGEIGRMLLVFPGISSDEDTVPGLLVNFKNPHLVNGARGIGTGRFEDYFLQELIPYVERHYRALPEGAHRGVDGFSLGGLTAMKIAAHYPRLFSSAGAYDGTFFYATKDGRNIRRDDQVFKAPLFNPHFGLPRDYQYGAANNPANLIIRGNKTELGRLYWMVQSGPEAAEPTDSNFYRARHLLEALAAKGIQNRLPAVIEQGRHNWQTADYHMRQSLPLHWQALRKF